MGEGIHSGRLVPYASRVSYLVAIAAGIVLASSAGLRAFVPLFAVGVASRTFGWDVATQMQWLASNTALTCFGIASALEIAADKIPVVDHALDAVHTIIGPIAGALAGIVTTAWKSRKDLEAQYDIDLRKRRVDADSDAKPMNITGG